MQTKDSSYIYAIIEEDIQDIVTENFSKDELIEEGIWASRDLISLSRVVPRHLRWFVKDWAKKGYSFDLNFVGIEKQILTLTNSILFLSLSILAGVFVTLGVYLMQDFTEIRSVPVVTWVFWGIGALLFSRGYLFVKR